MRKRTTLGDIARMQAQAAAWRMPTIQLGYGRAGARCSVCRLMYPLAFVPRNWVKVWLCRSHLNWFDQACIALTSATREVPKLYPKSSQLGPTETRIVPLTYNPDDQSDPRPLIEYYMAEGIQIQDHGLITIPGYESRGPQFVTDIQDGRGNRHTVCIKPQMALNTTPEQFLLIRCRAVLDGIRHLLQESAK